MNLKITLFTALFVSFFQLLNAQTGIIKGTVKTNSQLTEFAQVIVDSSIYGAVTNSKGEFTIDKIPFGTYQITASYIGFTKTTKDFTLNESQPEINLEFNLSEQTMELEGFVVTATKTPKRQTDAPVIVNVINSQTLDNLQACNLSEGLKFQPGLRVETDCQTCNYTQLRINGLGGAYSQILINGRSVFSPLTGLYGLELLPANIIDRIEVVRGGGSSLYGSSAIGGTVNVITKTPINNSYELNLTYQNIDGQTNDNNINGNATLISENRNSGISLFMNLRERGFYDANNDNFSEIPRIKNTSFGASLFFIPKENQKLELNISSIHEYRYGGEMLWDKPAYHAQQSEERSHKIWIAGVDYQLNFNNDNTYLITYLAWQNTGRKHYTGIQPDEGSPEYIEFVANPPYGNSNASSYNFGMQLNHSINHFLNGKNMLTLGAEYVYDDVLDEIPTYEYLIDQTTKSFGVFLQSDWEIFQQLTLLTGVRMDRHNMLTKTIFNPRASLLYKIKENTQFRFSYGTGFRAPQAFDADLHIAFAAGGISRVSLSPELKEEKSQSFNTSINYDKPMKYWIVGFTAETFYNRLKHAFYLQPIGQDQHGELFVKQNGDGATVQGITLELRFNYNRKIQLESGFTLQSSKFDNPVEYIDGLTGIKEFTRTPNDYAYAILTLTPTEKWNATVNYLYTGKMKIPHFAGALNQSTDEIINSDAFSELSMKVAYSFPIGKLASIIECYGGIKNVFNAYQDDFDIGKYRDSNFIYGPAQPRTFYIGIKLKSI